MTRQDVPKELERVRQRFEQWRQLPRRRGRRRIPERLWRAAVDVAGKHGAYMTARALRLDYRRLKDRLTGAGQHQRGDPSDGRGASFVELMAPALGGGTECVVELEDDRGARMRIQLKGAVPPELVALAKALWRDEG